MSFEFVVAHLDVYRQSLLCHQPLASRLDTLSGKKGRPPTHCICLEAIQINCTKSKPAKNDERMFLNAEIFRLYLLRNYVQGEPNVYQITKYELFEKYAWTRKGRRIYPSVGQALCQIDVFISH